MKRHFTNLNTSPNRIPKSPSATDRKKQSPQTRSPNSLKQSVQKPIGHSNSKINSKNKENQMLPSKEPSLIVASMERVSEKSSRLEGSRVSNSNVMLENQRNSQLLDQVSMSRISNTPGSVIKASSIGRFTEIESKRGSTIYNNYETEIGKLPPNEDSSLYQEESASSIDHKPLENKSKSSTILILGLIPILLIIGYMIAGNMNLSGKQMSDRIQTNYTIPDLNDSLSKDQLIMQAEIILKTIKQELTQCERLFVQNYQMDLMKFYYDNQPETLWMILIDIINEDPFIETIVDDETGQNTWVRRQLPI